MIYRGGQDHASIFCKYYDLFTFTESRLISNSHWSTYYNTLLCVWGERGIANCMLIFQFIYVWHSSALPVTLIAGMREREASRFSKAFEFKL